MANNVWFYIRSIFEESECFVDKSRSLLQMRHLFDECSKISSIDYRRAIHDIQLSVLTRITNNFIYNKRDSKHSSLPFHVVQEKTKKQLLELPDDAIVIPLDDDDWISPFIPIKELNLLGSTYWEAVSFNFLNDKWSLRKFRRRPKLDMDTSKLSENQTHLLKQGVLASCQSFSANIIKKLINTPLVNPLLQKHTTGRSIIRSAELKELNITEKHMEENYAVYLDHACNHSVIKTAYNNPKNLSPHAFLTEVINNHKTSAYDSIDSIIPSNYEWAKPLLHKIQNLNKQL